MECGIAVSTVDRQVEAYLIEKIWTDKLSNVDGLYLEDNKNIKSRSIATLIYHEARIHKASCENKKTKR